MNRILVVDDEPQIRRALSLHLGVRGYEVLEADTGERAIQLAASEHPDVVLLDLGLPGMDGVVVIEALRGWTTVPIIVLTVRDDERSKVQALDAGADDYVTKPFGMAELLPVCVRCCGVAPRPTMSLAEVTTSSFRLDLIGHRAFAGDVEVRLTPTEWAMVEYLVRYPGRLVTYRQLSPRYGDLHTIPTRTCCGFTWHIFAASSKSTALARSTSSPTPAWAIASRTTAEVSLAIVGLRQDRLVVGQILAQHHNHRCIAESCRSTGDRDRNRHPVTTRPPITLTDRRGDVGAGRQVVHLADVESLLDAGRVGASTMWNPRAVSS